MPGYTYTGADIARERIQTLEQCAKIADELAIHYGEGEGEIYIAKKIAERGRK